MKNDCLESQSSRPSKCLKFRSLLESRRNDFKKTSISSAAHGDRHLDESKYAGIVKASSIPFSAFSCDCSSLNLLPSDNGYFMSAVRSVVDVPANNCTVPQQCHTVVELPCSLPVKTMPWIWQNNSSFIMINHYWCYSWHPLLPCVYF